MRSSALEAGRLLAAGNVLQEPAAPERRFPAKALHIPPFHLRANRQNSLRRSVPKFPQGAYFAEKGLTPFEKGSMVFEAINLEDAA